MISVTTVGSGSRDRSLHSSQPDSGQGCRDLLRIELLVFFPTEKLLNQKVIYHHAEEPASCQQWVHFAKFSLTNTLANVAAKSLVVIRHKGPEETFGKRVVFESCEPQQPGHLRVVRRSNQKFTRHAGENLEIIIPALENLLDALPP